MFKGLNTQQVIMVALSAFPTMVSTWLATWYVIMVVPLLKDNVISTRNLISTIAAVVGGYIVVKWIANHLSG